MAAWKTDSARLELRKETTINLQQTASNTISQLCVNNCTWSSLHHLSERPRWILLQLTEDCRDLASLNYVESGNNEREEGKEILVCFASVVEMGSENSLYGSEFLYRINPQTKGNLITAKEISVLNCWPSWPVVIRVEVCSHLFVQVLIQLNSVF